MVVKKGQENTKKAAGNARKAAAEAEKQAARDEQNEQKEAEQWNKGAKNNAKKEAQADKAAEAARKKAEKEALLAEEEASMPSKPKGAGAKTAQKKARGTLDLSGLEGEPDSKKSPALNASGIDNALDALSLTGAAGSGDKIDRHPERRFKAAYTVFQERRLAEMEDDKSLRRQQKIDLIRKEFDKSAENPFNQGNVGRFDMSKEELDDIKRRQREEVEGRLAEKS